jgi:hypothetical protein
MIEHGRKTRRCLVAAMVSLLATGCTMCPNPFDYSGPVPNGSAPQNDFRARSNGVIPIGTTPQPWPQIVERDVEEPMIAPEPAAMSETIQVSGEEDVPVTK